MRNIDDIKPGITVNDIRDSIVRAFRAECGGNCTGTALQKTSLLGSEFFSTTYANLSSAHWNLGMTPRFKDLLRGRNADGGFAFQLDVDHAVITGADVSGDALDTEGMEELSETLPGLPYDANEIRKRAKEKSPFVKGALVLLADLISADPGNQNSK